VLGERISLGIWTVSFSRNGASGIVDDKGDLSWPVRGFWTAGSIRGSYPRSPERGGRALKGDGRPTISLPGIIKGAGTGGLGFMSSMEDWISVIKLSKLDVSEGLFPDLEPRDLDGLVRELAWLAWLGRRSG
jgi:hypothetical protein